MEQSVINNNLDDTYLAHTRNFILDEVEADIVYLQNKIIGKNHVQGNPNYRYKAWYKAKDKVIFSINESPKTDPGFFIIEETEEVIAYACNGVEMYDGFHAQQGGKYHAFEHCDGCFRPEGKSQSIVNGEDDKNENIRNQDFKTMSINEVKNAKEKEFNLYPNPVTDKLIIENILQIPINEVSIYDLNGVRSFYKRANKSTVKIATDSLEKGVYIVKIQSQGKISTHKLVVL